MDKGTFIGTCLLGLAVALAIFFPLGAKRRASIPAVAWWLCMAVGSVTCVFGLSHSTVPSFAPRITAVGTTSDWIEKRVGRDTKFVFRFVPEGGKPVDIETLITVPHWGYAEELNGRKLRIVYLDDISRNPSNEAIDIKILEGSDAGWHDSLDARPFGVWLAIPIGAALGGFGYFGIRYKKDDRKAAEAPLETSSVGSL
jgi:hypothetical protein